MTVRLEPSPLIPVLGFALTCALHDPDQSGQRSRTSAPAQWLFSDYVKTLTPPLSPMTRQDTAPWQRNNSTTETIPGPTVASLKLGYFGGPEVVAQFEPQDSAMPDLNAHLVANYLSSQGAIPKRMQNTSDGSTLLEYFRWRKSACVDVFPNGEVVVVIGKRKIDNIYEFDLSELPKVAELLRDAGFAR
jgi:hypothetical protein